MDALVPDASQGRIMKHRKSLSLPAFPSLSSSARSSPTSCSAPSEPLPFVELLARSNFSFLQGASHPEELVLRAKVLGLNGIAICDVNGLYGIVRGYQAAEKPSLFDAEQLAFSNADGIPKRPFRYLCGAELTPYDSSPIALLPMNKDGYSRLCHLIAKAKRPAPKGHISIRLQDILDANEDLLAFPLPPWEESQLKRLHEAFQDRIYLPVCKDLTWESVRLYKQVLEIERSLGISLFATARPLFHDPSRKPLHDVLTCILHKTTLDEAATRLTPNRERYLKGPDEMLHLFRERPDLVSRTLEIASRVEFSLSELRYRYPREYLPPGKTASEFLRELVEKGVAWRYAGETDSDFMAKVRRQVEKELALIQELEYEDYFLTLWDICQFASQRGILHQGRGSAANSVVCFTLGLTSVDPIRLGLLFERFISRERGEPPDIDIDFEHERREEVIQYIYSKYGERHAAMVCTVITYRSRMAIRETAKVMGISLPQIDALVKFMGREGISRLVDMAVEKGIEMPTSRRSRDSEYDPDSRMPIPERPPQTSSTELATVDLSQFGLDTDRFQKLLNIALELQGFPRHLGIHTGGFVISHEPVIDIVPVESASMTDRYVIQWNKDDINALCLMKVDVLSLGMLSALKKSLQLLHEHKGIDWNLAQIPQDDRPTYEMIQKADTVGVFQIESRAQMSLLPRLKPERFYDLVISVAIVRPGPIQGGMVHPYLKRRAGREKVTYAHPDLEPILKKTLGIPLFQEQIMQIAVTVAGFTPGEADELRRVISSAWKKKVVMEGLRQRVINGILAHARDSKVPNHLSREYAEQIYRTIEGFASYGFPESHAASFALLTYASCYLKCHHPDVFVCALLNSQPMGFYSPRQLVADAQRHGVVFHELDVQNSEWDYKLEHGNSGLHVVRVGFRSIHGLRKEHARRIVDERQRGGPFQSLNDFIMRTRLPRPATLRLAAAGAFESFGLNARQALWRLQGMSFDPQSLFFGSTLGLDPERDEKEAALIPEESSWEEITREYETKGFSVDKHPLSVLRPELRRSGRRYTTAAGLKSLRDKTPVRVAGLKSLIQKPPTAKGMCFVSIEDETGLMNLVLTPDLYQKFRSPLLYSLLLDVEGYLEFRDGVRNIRVRHLKPLTLP